MRNYFLLILVLCFLFLIPTSGLVLNKERPLSQVSAERRGDIIARLDEINGKLKGLSDEELNQREMAGLANKVWRVLDDRLVSYLDIAGSISVEELNQRLEALLETTTTPDKLGWSAGVELHGVVIPGVYLATYEDYYWTGNLISTLRVVEKVGDHWQLAGQMEQSPVVTELEPRHRAQLQQGLKEKNLLLRTDRAASAQVQNGAAAALHPIGTDNISISEQTIQAIDGGLEFVSIHSSRSTISEPTAIRWVWNPSRGLTAASWIWGDQWEYDRASQKTMARWQNADKSKEGKMVEQGNLMQ
jgi:hypothetical protein